MVALDNFPAKRLASDDQIFPSVQLLRGLGKGRGRESLQLRRSRGVFRFGGKVVPLVWIGLQIVQFLAVLAVTDVASITIDDGIFARVHVRQDDIAVLGGLRIGERACQRFAFQLLAWYGQNAEVDQRWIHVDQLTVTSDF